uniref:Uncharacterized protein n=1 Tax=Anguilla anguilla TaxID=7936 RepID=A0A0E9W9R5_ANGAN
MNLFGVLMTLEDLPLTAIAEGESWTALCWQSVEVDCDSSAITPPSDASGIGS